MGKTIKIISAVFWFLSILFILYLFKQSLSNPSREEDIWSFAFFYTLCVFAVSFAFLPIVFSGKK